MFKEKLAEAISPGKSSFDVHETIRDTVECDMIPVDRKCCQQACDCVARKRSSTHKDIDINHMG